MIKNTYGLSKISVLVGIVVLVVAGFGIWRITRRAPVVDIPLAPEDADATFVPPAWPMFYNADLNFSVQYPPGFRASGNVSIPLQIIEAPTEDNPTPVPILTTFRREGDLEETLEYMRATFVVEEIERLPYTRYIKVIAREKQRPEVQTEYFVRSNGQVSYVLFGWEGMNWKYTANVASSLEFED